MSDHRLAYDKYRLSEDSGSTLSEVENNDDDVDAKPTGQPSHSDREESPARILASEKGKVVAHRHISATSYEKDTFMVPVYADVLKVYTPDIVW